MKEKASNLLNEYSSAIFTSDPIRIGYILNNVIHNPDSAILVEPVKMNIGFFIQETLHFLRRKTMK